MTFLNKFWRGFWRHPIVAECGVLACVLLVLVLVFGASSRNFLTLTRLTIIANMIPGLTVMAVGMTFVLVIAGIDLSVGSVSAFCGSMLGVAMLKWGWPLGPAIPLCLAFGALCGAINGAITVRWAIPSFIVTLGMLEVVRGAAFWVTDMQTMYMGSTNVALLSAPLPWLRLSPAFLLSLVAVVVGQLALTRTVFGRHAIAIGANEEAVRLSGIDPRPVKFAIFCLAGMLAGMGGVFNCADLGSANPNAGVGLELLAIAAVVIGGTSLMGGRGSVVNSFFGVLIIAVLNSGLASYSTDEWLKRVVIGLVIVVAVIADTYRQRLARRHET